MTAAIARDWRGQHLAEDTIREVPADEAGEFKRVVPSPLATMASRKQITPEQKTAGEILHADFVGALHNRRDGRDHDGGTDPSIRVPRSQSPGLPPQQILDSMRYMGAMDAVTDGSKTVVEVVCCHERTLTEWLGPSRRPQRRARTALLIGLQDLVAYYAGEGRLR